MHLKTRQKTMASIFFIPLNWQRNYHGFVKYTQKHNLETMLTPKTSHLLLQCYQCYKSIKTAKKFSYRIFWKHIQNFVRLLACQSPGCVHLYIFCTTTVIKSDLWNCSSNKHLSTAPWCFPLSFITYLSSSNHLQKGEALANWCWYFVDKFITLQKSAACIVSIIIDAPAVAYTCN